ncbi:MAG: PKD domain-containing protein [Thermoplasmata archaeon]|nr:PKD domain-containing protein [Thermoplasmata archaeon]
MTARSLRPGWVAFAIVGICLLLAVPTQWSTAGTTNAALPVGPSHAAKTTAAAHPAVFQCPNPPLGYGSVSGFLPPTPVQAGQTCPGPIVEDTIHGSFSSNVPGSGERWKEAIYLPANGTPGQPFEYSDVFLGMVVSGDPSSLYRQSYAQVIFTPSSAGPNTTVTWGVSAAVWAMHNETAGGACSDSMTFVWNWSFWCIQNMIQNGAGLVGPTGLAGGTWFNVTFDGQIGQSSGMTVWANDSTNFTGNFSFQLNNTTTGAVAYEPFFNDSCNDLCFLNWSYPFGLGIGWDICPDGSPPFAACDTYNQTVWDGANPVEFGPPEFWVNASAGYGGDYQYFAPMSASGECSSSAVVAVASCNNYNAFGGTGFYPFFSWNGSLLNFGDEYPWTVNDMGGEYTEYFQTGPVQHDIVPLFLERFSNDSHGGYVEPNTALNVSTTVSDLGVVRSVQLTYSLNSATSITVPMPLMAGTTQRGTYNGTVPTGANGWINFTVTATNNASMNDTEHGTVYRGPLPHFSVVVDTQPQSCTTATVNGTLVHNGTTLSLTPGTYPVTSSSCYPYEFGKWLTSAGLRVANASSISSNLTVTRPGTVTANWTYVRPDVTVTFVTAPTTPCGTVEIANQTYGQGFSSVASILYGLPANLSVPTGCAGESFAGWTFVGNFTILGTTLIAGGNGTLTANFVSSSTGSTLSFFTDPATCGGVLYRGAGYTGGERLTVNATPYAVAPLPCAHYGFQQFDTTGGATVTNGNLTVTSAGSIEELNFVLTEVTLLMFPGSCSVLFDGVRYGNDTVLVVANNSTHTITQNACPGYYPFSITPTLGLSLYGDLLTVNTSGTVLANWLFGSSSQFLEFQTDPGNCGTISFGGGTWSNTNYTNVPQNATGPISAHPCANYGFVRWVPSPGLQISNGIAYINASGSILAVFRPIAPVAIQTTPSNCGTVSVNGVAYASNSTAILTEDFPYPITPLPCAHYSFVDWSDTVGATIVNGTLYLASEAILTANFAPTPYIVQVHIDPGTCGSLYVNGISETNGTNVTLPFGTYPLRAAPCLGNLLVGYNGTGGVQVIGTSSITVGANGTLNATYRPVPPSVTLSVPSSSFAGDIVTLAATVAVLVPPYTYNYSWTFGDGSSATTPANFTAHTYNQPGTYTVTVVVHDPYGRNATTSGTIQVVASSATSSLAIPTSTSIILGIVVVAVVALLAVAFWRRRPPTAAPMESAAPYDEGTPDDAVYLPSGADGTDASTPSGDQA